MFKHLLALSDKEWHKSIYYYSTFISIALIIIAYTGVVYINPVYITKIHSFLLLYVCAILLIRFNPYVKSSHDAGHSAFDRKIAFTAGIILLTTVVAKKITDYAIPMKELLENIVTI